MPETRWLNADQIQQLADQVRLQRAALQLGPARAAARCGLSEMTLRNVEAAKARPSPETLRRLATGLGLDLAAYLPCDP